MLPFPIVKQSHRQAENKAYDNKKTASITMIFAVMGAAFFVIMRNALGLFCG